MSDNSPIGNTCGTIDDILATISGALDALNNEDYDEVYNLLTSIDGRYSPLEEVRTANEKLREWGNDLFNELEEIKNEL